MCDRDARQLVPFKNVIIKDLAFSAEGFPASIRAWMTFSLNRYQKLAMFGACLIPTVVEQSSELVSGQSIRRALVHGLRT